MRCVHNADSNKASLIGPTVVDSTSLGGLRWAVLKQNLCYMQNLLWNHLLWNHLLWNSSFSKVRQTSPRSPNGIGWEVL